MNILLVHGFGGGYYEYKPIIKFLSIRHPEIKFFQFVYEKKFGQVSISENSKKLAEYISQNLLGENFSVIAISQGGIIFRDFARKFPEFRNKIEKVITLCTPFHGSFLAHTLSLIGFKDLRLDSSLLKELLEFDDDLKYFCVYNPLDSMVIPGTSAKYERAVENKRVFASNHPATFYSRKTLAFIDKVLFS